MTKPPVCYNCGAPWKPKCEYCGTEYQAPVAFAASLPIHNPEYLTLAQAQANAWHTQQSLLDAQMVRQELSQPLGLGLGSILGGLFR